MNDLLTEPEFRKLTDLVFQYTGIRMGDKKRPLITGRLARRLRMLALPTYGAYLNYLLNDESGEEREIFIDLVTTHVTHFFREPEHFVFLSEYLKTVKQYPLRIWSAAVSTGEEAYSIGMVLQDRLGSSKWKILGTDISAESVARARTALYPISGVDQIPNFYKKNYLLKGRDSMDGYFTVDKEIRSSVQLEVLNLMNFSRLPNNFVPEIVFLRNVMIYFDAFEKQGVIDRIAKVMPAGGILMIGHSESLNGLKSTFKLLKTAIYQKE
ncbi:MAG: protein-glutamate O-methyltransferase CheR [Leptonema sp. (in: Bacteria)]|nr:protein-glutamate O-methyltransferase CheR [Leptonema sp. (in: bacteria)]